MDLNRQHLAKQFPGFKSLHHHQSHLTNSIAYQSDTPKNTVTRLSPRKFSHYSNAIMFLDWKAEDHIITF
jgi:hypothetical protein